MPEHQPYDHALKSLLGDEAAQILPRLLEGLELIGEQNIEIDRTTLKADLVYNVLYKRRPHILNMELQTGSDKEMPKRLLQYHVGLHARHDLPVISMVMYPFETSIPVSPYREESADGDVLTFHFKVLALCKWTAIPFVQDRVIPMYTLLPAMKNVSVPMLVQALKDMKHYYTRERFSHHLARFIRILQRSKSLSEEEKQTMRSELNQNYDSFIDENPDVQERVAQGEAKGAQKIVTSIVEVRFPTLAELAQQRVANIQSLEKLDQLAKQIATASDEQMARWVLDSYAA